MIYFGSMLAESILNLKNLDLFEIDTSYIKPSRFWCVRRYVFKFFNIIQKLYVNDLF